MEDLDNIINLLKEFGPILVALGFIAKEVIGWLKVRQTTKVKIKQLDNESDKIEIDKSSSDVEAAQKLVGVFTSVITPLEDRIKRLEEEAIENRKTISALNQRVFELQTSVYEKDLVIIELRTKYESQVSISNEQEIKIANQGERIQQQERRIIELESELGIRKDMKNGFC